MTTETDPQPLSVDSFKAYEALMGAKDPKGLRTSAP